jgi:hypothetical protein
MANTYFSRTPASAGNRQIFTFSLWTKISNVTSRMAFYNWGNSTGTVGSGDGNIFFNQGSDQSLVVSCGGGVDMNIATNQRFRDTSAWYHVVIAFDTTQATASNRVKVYINGTQVTSFSATTYPSQNYNLNVNNTSIQRLGTGYDGGITYYYDGSMASFYLIDGQQLTPSSFGETDATTGIWKPKSYSGSYGTNGFFLKFENSASLGTDSSGNGNNFTVNGTPTQTVDTPSNNFATLNPLDGLPSGSGGGATVTYSNGNTRSDSRYGAGEYPLCRANIQVNKGKWYWEAKVDTTGIGLGVGVMSATANNGDFRGGEWVYGAGFSGHSSGASMDKYDNSGTIVIADVSNSGGTIGYALDLDNGTFKIYLNGTLQATDTTLPSDNSVYLFPVTIGTFSASNSWSPISFNFGNGYFATTAITSPVSDTAGLGKFQYAVPAGYYSLCTKNINSQG